MKSALITFVTVCASLSFANSASKAPNGNSVRAGTPGAVTHSTQSDTNRIPATNTYGTVPPNATGDRATTYPESTSTGQNNPPTTEEVRRQRNEMNEQRNEMKKSADCSKVSDSKARANCEAKTRSL